MYVQFSFRDYSLTDQNCKELPIQRISPSKPFAVLGSFQEYSESEFLKRVNTTFPQFNSTLCTVRKEILANLLKSSSILYINKVNLTSGVPQEAPCPISPPFFLKGLNWLSCRVCDSLCTKMVHVVSRRGLNQTHKHIHHLTHAGNGVPNRPRHSPQFPEACGH